jgi:hypothetical protein
VEPSRPRSAFGLWLGDNRAAITKEAGDTKGSVVGKIAGEKWKVLSAAQKAPGEMKAAALEAEFEKAMEEFVAAGGVPWALKLSKPGVWVTATPVRTKRQGVHALQIDEEEAVRREASRASTGVLALPIDEEEAVRWGWPSRRWRGIPLSPDAAFFAELFTPERSPGVPARRATSSSATRGDEARDPSLDVEGIVLPNTLNVQAELALLALRALLTEAEEAGKRRRLAIA